MSPSRSLTDYELAVLTRLAEGRTDHAIARELGKHISTIKAHRQSTYRALGARNAPHAVLLAHRAGYFDDEEEEVSA